MIYSYFETLTLNCFLLVSLCALNSDHLILKNSPWLLRGNPGDVEGLWQRRSLNLLKDVNVQSATVFIAGSSRPLTLETLLAQGGRHMMGSGEDICKNSMMSAEKEARLEK